jgi:G protein beta subunit-like protein
VRSLTVAMDGSLVVAANNSGTCYVWRAMRGSYLTTHFEPLHKLRAHQGECGMGGIVGCIVGCVSG